MRRPHVFVLGVVVALGLTGVAGCAKPVTGQATYRVGAAAGSGADAAAHTDAGSTPARRPHRPKPRHAPTRHTAAPTTPAPPPPPTHTQASPPRKKPPQTTEPGAPTLAEFSVCLSMFQLSREPDGAFRALPRHASMSSRAQVAKAYSAAYRHMMRVVRTSGLPPDDVVRMQALAVASATRRMARALPSGSGVSNRGLRAAFVRLTQLCAH